LTVKYVNSPVAEESHFIVKIESENETSKFRFTTLDATYNFISSYIENTNKGNEIRYSIVIDDGIVVEKTLSCTYLTQLKKALQIMKSLSYAKCYSNEKSEETFHKKENMIAYF